MAAHQFDLPKYRKPIPRDSVLIVFFPELSEHDKQLFGLVVDPPHSRATRSHRKAIFAYPGHDNDNDGADDGKQPTEVFYSVFLTKFSGCIRDLYEVFRVAFKKGWRNILAFDNYSLRVLRSNQPHETSLVRLSRVMRSDAVCKDIDFVQTNARATKLVTARRVLYNEDDGIITSDLNDDYMDETKHPHRLQGTNLRVPPTTFPQGEWKSEWFFKRAMVIHDPNERFLARKPEEYFAAKRKVSAITALSQTTTPSIPAEVQVMIRRYLEVAKQPPVEEKTTAPILDGPWQTAWVQFKRQVGARPPNHRYRLAVCVFLGPSTMEFKASFLYTLDVTYKSLKVDGAIIEPVVYTWNHSQHASRSELMEICSYFTANRSEDVERAILLFVYPEQWKKESRVITVQSDTTQPCLALFQAALMPSALLNNHQNLDHIEGRTSTRLDVTMYPQGLNRRLLTNEFEVLMNYDYGFYTME